jgi:hypothetical protein
MQLRALQKPFGYRITHCVSIFDAATAHRYLLISRGFLAYSNRGIGDATYPREVCIAVYANVDRTRRICRTQQLAPSTKIGRGRATNATAKAFAASSLQKLEGS